jgi:hypothetical protein
MGRSPNHKIVEVLATSLKDRWDVDGLFAEISKLMNTRLNMVASMSDIASDNYTKQMLPYLRDVFA